MKYDHTKKKVTEAINTTEKKIDKMFDKIMEVRNKEGSTMSMVIEAIEKLEATIAEKIFFALIYGAAEKKETESSITITLAHLAFLAIKTNTMTKREAIKYIKGQISDPTEAAQSIEHLEEHLKEEAK